MVPRIWLVRFIEPRPQRGFGGYSRQLSRKDLGAGWSAAGPVAIQDPPTLRLELPARSSTAA